tara:strand:+ start:188 stop:472 length:285 start_codon:yes stop_codon:yes gene_type:complete
MDNIKDENLKKLGKFIAQELIELAKDTTSTDWVEDSMRDYTIGELARCVTLQNLYLDREEYEKCAIMKLRIMELSDKLNIPLDDNLTNLEDDEE